MGRATEAEIDAELARDPDPDAELHAIAARAARPSDAAKAAALDRLLSDEALPITALSGIAAEVWHPNHEPLLAPHISRYLEALPRHIADRDAPAFRNIVGYTFPVFGVGPDTATVARGLAARADIMPVVRHSLLDKAHLVDRALHARAVWPAAL